MVKQLKALLTLLILLSITPALLAQSDLEGINNLEGTSEQEFFLTSIYRSDRQVRHFEDSVMLADGWRSPAHVAAIARLRITDSLNSLKIDRYLDAHAYPDRENFTDEARIAPWQVLVHSLNREIRRKHFGDLYDAYKDGDLETRRFLLFLEDEYQKVFEKDFQSYKQGNQRVEELIKALESEGLSKSKLRFP